MHNGYGNNRNKQNTWQNSRKFQGGNSRMPSTPFINPYSFIPIENKEPERKAQENGLLSGYVDIAIDVKSPIFIPNTSKDYSESVTVTSTDRFGNKNSRKEEHKKSVFYSYTDLENVPYSEAVHPDRPIIPGSELRGMIRNVYEQLTNSCFVHTGENNLPFKRTPEPKIMCIMKWNDSKMQWEIFTNIRKGTDYFTGAIIHSAGNMELDTRGWKGKKDIVPQVKNTYEKFDYAKEYKVDFDTISHRITKNPNGKWLLHIPPMIVIGTDIPVANKQVIYNADSLSGGIAVDSETIKRFEYVLSIDENVKGGYTDKAFNKHDDSQKIYKNYKNRYKAHEPLIVYVDTYSVDKGFENDIVYMAPACFFGNKISDILEADNHHEKCSDTKKACPTCRLFGTVTESGAIKGKLRFLDAEAGSDIEYDRETTLPILASPKISATEFYLNPPKALFDGSGRFNGIWNYDYYTTYSNDPNEKTVYNRNYYMPKLLGRKVYLSGAVKSENEKTKLNMTVTPIKKGTFKTKVFFNDLTEEELAQLMFCIKLGDGCNHKIGHGKPVGYGRIKLAANGINTYSYSIDNGAIKKTETPYQLEQSIEKQVAESDAAKLILEYTKNLSIDDENMVDYPKAADNKGNETVFAWFSKNRGSANAPKINQVLPVVGSGTNKLKK